MWTQEQAVAYESAQECMTEWMAMLTAELESGSVSPDRAASLQFEMASLAFERRSLDATDAGAVNAARQRYGELVRLRRAAPTAGL